MLADSIDSASDDRAARMLREQQVEAQRMLEAARSALLTDGELLSGEERKTIQAAIEELARTADGDVADAIVAANHALAVATENFAMQRMNRYIRSALSGARIDDILAPAVRQDPS